MARLHKLGASPHSVDARALPPRRVGRSRVNTIRFDDAGAPNRLFLLGGSMYNFSGGGRRILFDVCVDGN